MECSHNIFSELYKPQCFRVFLKNWSLALFFSGTLVSIPVCSAQDFVRPNYVPSVSEAYFFGDSKDVYPDQREAQPEHFVSAPGESHPVPNREVRARNWAERRENLRQKFLPGISKSQQRSTPERTPSVTSTVTYPDGTGFPPIPPSHREGTEFKSPLWNEDGTTSALPIRESVSEEEVLEETFPVSESQPRNSNILEDVSEENLDLLLEDVTIPAETSIPRVEKTQTGEESTPLKVDSLLESEEVSDVKSGLETEIKTKSSNNTESKVEEEFNVEEESSPESELVTVLNSGSASKSILNSSAESQPDSEETTEKAPDELLIEVQSIDETVSDLHLETSTVEEIEILPPVQETTVKKSSVKPAGTVPVRSRSPISRAASRFQQESTERLDSRSQRTDSQSNTSNSSIPEPISWDSDPSLEQLLEEVPASQNSNSLNTTEYRRDFQVQQTAFFFTSSESKEKGSVEKSNHYPTSGEETFRFPWQAKKAAQMRISSQEESMKQVAENRQNSIVQAPVHVESQSSTAVEHTPYRTNPIPTSHSIIKESNFPMISTQSVSDSTEEHSVLSVQKQDSVSESVEEQTTDLESTEEQTNDSEIAVYTPVFPEQVTPIWRLSLVLPVRSVFHDFEIRKNIDRSSLPWYATYIRELDVNEEHLFNSLRVLGNARISQSRCAFSLMEAGIIASHPTSAEEANRLLNIYENIQYYVLEKTQQIDAQNDKTLKEREILKAEAILDFMHEHVFVKYVLEGTTLSNLLDLGNYNCVTASLLYCSLAEKAGLNVTAVELPGHAMCWVYLTDGERLAVETTCANWFKYRNDPETQQKVICKLIRDASPQLEKESDQVLLQQVPQPISDKRLIAKIYYNRGVDLLSENDFAGALEANVIAYCLDPQSKTTFGNLLATMNNWAIALCREGNYEEATALLRTGLKYQPSYPPFKNNHTHVYHQWVDSLYRNGKLGEALQIAGLAASEQPEVEHFKRLQTQIRQSIAMLPQETITK